MLTKEQSDLVARIALHLSDRPVPTAAEILAAIGRAVEEADRMGYARGVIAGQNHMSQVMNRVLLPMSAP